MVRDRPGSPQIVLDRSLADSNQRSNSFSIDAKRLP